MDGEAKLVAVADSKRPAKDVPLAEVLLDVLAEVAPYVDADDGQPNLAMRVQTLVARALNKEGVEW